MAPFLLRPYLQAMLAALRADIMEVHVKLGVLFGVEVHRVEIHFALHDKPGYSLLYVTELFFSGDIPMCRWMITDTLKNRTKERAKLFSTHKSDTSTEKLRSQPH